MNKNEAKIHPTYKMVDFDTLQTNKAIFYWLFTLYRHVTLTGMTGGGSFHPGMLGGGSLYGSNQGSGYHAAAPEEKPLKVSSTCFVTK